MEIGEGGGPVRDRFLEVGEAEGRGVGSVVLEVAHGC